MSTDSTWPIERIIGRNVTRARKDADMTQRELGEAVAPYLGTTWPPQTVSNVEGGRRAFAAAEVVALAHVLGVTPAALFFPPAAVDVVMVGDVNIARQELTSPPGFVPSPSRLNDMRGEWSDVRDQLAFALDETMEQRKYVDSVAYRLRSLVPVLDTLDAMIVQEIMERRDPDA